MSTPHKDIMFQIHFQTSLKEFGFAWKFFLRECNQSGDPPDGYTLEGIVNHVVESKSQWERNQKDGKDELYESFPDLYFELLTY